MSSGGRSAVLRLVLVGAALFGAWRLFPSLRRVALEVRLEGRDRACAKRLELRIGREGRVDHAVRVDVDGPRLPPWTTQLNPGAHRLDGELTCSDGTVVALGPRPLEVAEDTVLTFPIHRLCPCRP